MPSMGLTVAEVNERACLAVRPFSDRLHVSPLSESLSDIIDTQRAAKRYVAGYNANARITRGLVLYAGPEVKEVKQGQIVRFSDSCTRELNADDSREYLIRESDVIEADGNIIGDIVLIDPVVPETITGVVVIPSFRPEVPEDGEVIEIGPGRLLKDGRRIKMEISIGDRVLIPRFAGQEVIKHGKTYLALRYTDLMGVINGRRDVLV